MNKKDAALEAVLLFHSGSPWDDTKRLRWLELAHLVLKDVYYLNYEATTRVLCDMVREALK